MEDELYTNGDEELDRYYSASLIRKANFPVDKMDKSTLVRQYDEESKSDKLFMPLDTGGYTSVGNAPAEMIQMPASSKQMAFPIPKNRRGNGLQAYYDDLGSAVKTVADPIITGVAQGVDRFTDTASDFLGKYIQFKLDPNLFDGQAFPEINPKEIIMDATGFEGIDVSMFEPDTKPGMMAKELISYVVGYSLTPGGPLGSAGKVAMKDAGAMMSEGPYIGNIFEVAAALGLENEITSYLSASIENPDDATLDERLASRIKATTDIPLLAGVVFAAVKILGNKAFQLAAGGLTGTALTAQEAEGGPLATFVRQTLKRMNRNVTNDVSYRIQHQPKMPEDGAPRLDNLTKDIQGNNSGYPNDFYSNDGRRLYAQGPRFKDDQYGIANSESYNIILSAKNNPEKEVTIYRSVPNENSINEINVGDFVTLSPTYAKLHSGSGYGDGGNDAGKILSKQVKVKEIFFDGNDVNEFGYFPEQTTTSEQIQTIVDNAKQAYEKKPNNENLKQEYFRLRKFKDKFLSMQNLKFTKNEQ